MSGDVQLMTTLKECKKYKDVIINSIIDVLSNHDYNTQLNNSKTEIQVKTDELSSVNKIINNELESVPDNIKNILIDTYRTREGVYIRLKFK